MLLARRSHCLKSLLVAAFAIAVSLGGYFVWIYRHDRSFRNTFSLHLFALLPRPGLQNLLLIGDSNIASLNCPMAFSRWHVLNLGFPGIRSQQLGNYLGAHLKDFPRVDASVLWIGLNDARPRNLNSEDVWQYEKRILDDLSKISNTVAVIAQPLLPNEGGDPGIDNTNRHIAELNSMIAGSAGRRFAIIFLFAGDADQVNAFSADGLHLNDTGYHKVCSTIGRWLGSK